MSALFFLLAFGLIMGLLIWSIVYFQYLLSKSGKPVPRKPAEPRMLVLNLDDIKHNAQIPPTPMQEDETIDVLNDKWTVTLAFIAVVLLIVYISF